MFAGYSLIPQWTGGRVPDEFFWAAAFLWSGIRPFEPFVLWLFVSLGAGRFSSQCANPFPVPPRLNVVAVIDVEKLLCMVLRLDHCDFSEIVRAHVCGIVFSTMVGRDGALRCHRPHSGRNICDIESYHARLRR
jgi:hypothetical protein